MLWSELRKRGYDLVPVNRNAETIDGVPAYPDIPAIEPAPEGVLLMVPAAESLEPVRQAVRAGVKRRLVLPASGKARSRRRRSNWPRKAAATSWLASAPFMFLLRVEPSLLASRLEALDRSLPR